MTIKEAILKRSSVRQFLDKQIDNQTLKKIINLARKAPSWINAQETQIYIAEGSLLNKMRKSTETLTRILTCIQNPIFHTCRFETGIRFHKRI